MRFKISHAPHLRTEDRAAVMRLDVLLALTPLVVYSCTHYGLRPLWLVMTGMGTAMLCEALGNLVLRRSVSLSDGAAAVTGGLIGILMSPLSPFWVPAAGAAFAVFAIKLPFGGTGRNIFNPAAGGLAFVSLCFSTQMFTYPDPSIPFTASADMITAHSPASLLASGGVTALSYEDILFGNFPGPIGAVTVIILAACAFYLIARRCISPVTLLSFITTCAAAAALFPRVLGVRGTVIQELCAGYLLFAGVFMITDPVTSPHFWPARLLHGFFGGVLVMAMRHFGQFEEGCCFAILLLGPLSSALDQWCWQATDWFRSRILKRQGGINIV